VSVYTKARHEGLWWRVDASCGDEQAHAISPYLELAQQLAQEMAIEAHRESQKVTR